MRGWDTTDTAPWDTVRATFRRRNRIARPPTTALHVLQQELSGTNIRRIPSMAAATPAIGGSQQAAGL